MKKVLKRIIGGAIFLVVIGSFIVGNYLVDYALARQGDGGNRKVKPVKKIENPIIKQNKLLQEEKTNEFLNNNEVKETSVVSNDGLNLKGYYYLNNSDKWALIIHGYRDNHEDMNAYAQRYFEKGYNVLMPDLRGNGNSEGKYIGMGCLDKDDMKLWVDWILKNNSNPEIVVHGLSMGAATTMMLAGEETPNNVKVFIEDAGFTSVRDIFESELKVRFHLPSFPILDAGGMVSKVKAGYAFDGASALEQIEKSTKPVMFIHATDDNFVPFRMLDELYNAKKMGAKKKLVAENAGHTEAKYALGEEYWTEVFKFIEENK
ncbi:alpha/beta hydrolase [Peptoniphilus asaccharolyticus]